MRWLDKAEDCVPCFRGWSAGKQDIAIITIVYFFSQGAILFLTGKWIDDWCPFWEEETLREMAYMAGGGEPAIWIKRLGYALPGNGYLFLTFSFFYMASLSLYWILVTIDEIPRWDRVWLVLFFTVCPVNDARVTNICFPYGFCYGVFFIAFFLLTQFFSIKNIFLRWLVRVCTLILFAASFPVNSFLVFYAIPLAYIWYREDRRGISLLWRYADFLVIPLIFWAMKKMLWPQYGFYANYQSFGVQSLVGAVFRTFPLVFDTMIAIFSDIVSSLSLWNTVCIWGIYKLYECFLAEKTPKMNAKKIWGGILAGAIFVWIGIFPYVVIGRSSIEIMGFSGKDALLVPLGGAMIVYYGICLCPVQEKLRHILYLAFIVISICCLNQRYVDYQEASYQQMAVGEHMRDSKEIREGQNFLWIHLEGNSWWSRFYVLSGIAREVYGDETRLFLSEADIHRKYWFEKGMGENMMTGKQYNLSEYELTNQNLDGIILYRYSPISMRMLLGMKFDELFRRERFKNRIRGLGHMDYVPADGFIVNDREMLTMWSKEAANDIAQRKPIPFVRPQ